MQVGGRTVINFEIIKREDIDYWNDDATILWLETLAVRQVLFEEDVYTILLNGDNTLTAVNRPALKLVQEFGERMHAPDEVMRLYAKKADGVTAYPFVHGKFQMISLLGACNKNTTWVMAHQIKGAPTCADDGFVRIQFKNYTILKVNASLKTVKERIKVADSISSMQSMQYRQLGIIHDFGSGEGNAGEYNFENRHLLEGAQEVYQFAEEAFDYHFRAVHKELYGPEINEDEYKHARNKVIRGCYRHNQKY